MATIKQPSFVPTNKLTAALVAGTVYEFVQPAIGTSVARMGDALGIALAVGPNSDMLLQIGVMALVGYFVKDRPNVTPLEPS